MNHVHTQLLVHRSSRATDRDWRQRKSPSFLRHTTAASLCSDHTEGSPTDPPLHVHTYELLKEIPPKFHRKKILVSQSEGFSINELSGKTFVAVTTMV